MADKITMDSIKEELYEMEDKIIRERQARKNKDGSTFSYRLYEIRVEKNREEEQQMSLPERKEAYRERFEDIVNQHTINIEDTLDKGLCLAAIGAIHNARKCQFELDNLEVN